MLKATLSWNGLLPISVTSGVCFRALHSGNEITDMGRVQKVVNGASSLSTNSPYKVRSLT